MARAGLTRDIAVCGGDTSSHALAAMEVRELRVRDLFVTAGPVCTADDNIDQSQAAGCYSRAAKSAPPSLLRDFRGEAN